MKSFVLLLCCLIGVTLASLNYPPFPEAFWDCDNIPAHKFRPDNVSATDLFTPEFAMDPYAATVPVGDMTVDHIVLHIRYARYLIVQNITGGDRTRALYDRDGECQSDPNKWQFRIGADEDYYFIQARISFAALKVTGCQFIGGYNISCVWWMTAIEHFVLGGVHRDQIQTVRWPILIILPRKLKAATTDVEVWPVASYQAAILVFEEYPWPDYSVRVVFLLMVHEPYQATGAWLEPAPGVQGWAWPPLPGQDLSNLNPNTTECVKYPGYEQWCYQQISVDLVPEQPCKDTPNGRRDYNGTYTLKGTTKCQEAFADDAKCALPTGPHEWFSWKFAFEFQTNDFCPTYLYYNIEGKLRGNIQTYSSAALDTVKTVFVADETVWGKIWVDPVDPIQFPWLIKRIDTERLDVGVGFDGITYTYYTLEPSVDSRLHNDLIFFSELQNVSRTATTPYYQWFSLVLASKEYPFQLGYGAANPMARHFIFNATVIVWYEWDTSFEGASVRLQTDTSAAAKALSMGLVVPVGGTITPSDYTPAATSQAVAAGLVAGIAVGCVALLAAVVVAAVIIRRRRAHYVEQKDSETSA